jgi:hypothetical protein
MAQKFLLSEDLILSAGRVAERKLIAVGLHSDISVVQNSNTI